MGAIAPIAYEGTVTAAPELKFASSGKAWLGLRTVFNSRRKDGDRWVDGPPTWVTVKLFGDMAEHVCDSVAKGDRVVIVGDLETEEWTGQDGEKRTSLTVMNASVGVSLRWATVEVQRSERRQPAAPSGEVEPF